MAEHPSDRTTTVADLVEAVRAFVAERHWERYHTPKNLAMSIAIEAAELMEHFQWLSLDEAVRAAQDPAVRPEIEDELADVLIYCLSLAATMGVDVSTIVQRKLAYNAVRFPVGKSEERR